MAIKNTALGGTDWTQGEAPSSTDLNDTIDAAVSKIQTLSAFWLNSDLYDVYDDFDSYSVGAFTTASSSKWTINNVNDTDASSDASITATTDAGGTSQELQLRTNSDASGGDVDSSCEAIAETLSENKHTWGRLYWKINYGTVNTNNGVDINIQIKIEGQSYVAFVPTSTFGDGSPGPVLEGYADFLCVSLGSNNYDLYVGGKKLFSNVSTATLKLYFKTEFVWTSGSLNGAEALIKIDDVRQSKSTIS